MLHFLLFSLISFVTLNFFSQFTAQKAFFFPTITLLFLTFHYNTTFTLDITTHFICLLLVHLLPCYFLPSHFCTSIFITADFNMLVYSCINSPIHIWNSCSRQLKWNKTEEKKSNFYNIMNFYGLPGLHSWWADENLIKFTAKSNFVCRKREFLWIRVLPETYYYDKWVGKREKMCMKFLL